MDYLWTPWRYAYITSADTAARPGVPVSLAAWPGDTGCVFCNLMAAINYAIEKGMGAEQAEAAGGLIVRGKHCFVCLNAFPYTSGHVMVMPYAHLDRLAALPVEAAHELIGSGAADGAGVGTALPAARLQLWHKCGQGRRGRRRRASASARAAPLGR